MKNRRYTKKQLHKKKCRAILGFITSLVLLCLASGLLVAKYYAERSNKGVATASGFYFTSNYLKNVSGKEETEYPVIYNTTPWNGTGSCDFDLQIRNYQNQLLYNDQNLNVIYNISFQLVDQSDRGTYQVSYGNDENNVKTITKDNAVTFENITLTGGMASVNSFTVSVSKPSDNTSANYRSTGIRVTATPVSPSYVTNSVKLGGILYASMVSAQYNLSHEFSIDSTKNLSDYSGFPYMITYTPDQDNSAHQVKVTWDSNQLEIDKFNEYSTLVSEDSDGKKYIVITMQPYSSVQITFYRAAGFNVGNSTDLENLVSVTDTSRSPEGSANNE